MYVCIPLTFSASATGVSANSLLSIPRLRLAPPLVVNDGEVILEDEIVHTSIRGFQRLLVR